MLHRHHRRALHALPGVFLLAVLTAGCATVEPESRKAAQRLDALVPAPRAAAPASPQGAALDAAALDPEAPATYRPVVRPGRAAGSVHAAPPARLAAGAPVTYPDGMAVTVDRVTRSVEQGQGVGAFPGRPLTVLSLTLRNGSPRPVDLSQVVVTTTYGERPRIATPVYDTAGARDFTGAVAPGGTAQATYVFALPPGQARVSTWVDVDSAHAAAAFTGMVP